MVDQTVTLSLAESGVAIVGYSDWDDGEATPHGCGVYVEN